MNPSFTALLLFCRPGFEKECLAEVIEAAAEKGLSGWSKLIPDSGMVQFQCDQARPLYQHLPELVFTREVWPVFAAVEHHRADGFTWQPEHAVDWLVCDMIEPPDKVMRHILHWLQQGWTQQALFNLKMPMKKRWQAWQNLRGQLEDALQSLPGCYGYRAKHLYFDREEITVLIAPQMTLEDVHD